ncbi:hypothetical protein BL250_02295 [Erwinia sp. OLTSP20]|uniref:hypothetical protein n=1 Tax=unclassified Erwinia TaxID=2622719 RepID=UPI000C18149A|nr:MULTISPECIES: hypothetical protein [unclassified Erwinia]PIJ48826.1 hypothetical protein BV501_16250 [Erwinia sp. OAMSP11]PIJ69448.1 hypothetical protein BK416_15190 [Erwinia sp. OLSSP12]PIJ79282.1 hypothetical protein BLD47_15495 [Erwinia sp. OLCASP19]PIJ80808.1 hypothetical protein BLD46_14655 [Erwinia sp. OLMTSP26]PIJ82960.1 hypothetical protein BLD49_14550 [Erwinia sp. OLMDSP33]
MRIDKKLNFVTSVNRDDGEIVYVHVIPLPHEVVEENCVLLGSLFNNFFSTVGALGSTRVAAMMLRKAIQLGEGDNARGTEKRPTLLDDIARMSTVVCKISGDWQNIPLDTAVSQGVITPDEYREVEGEIVFFIVSSAIQKSSLIPGTIGAVLGVYSGQLTSLSATEYNASLPTLKTDTDTPTPSVPQETSFIPS